MGPDDYLAMYAGYQLRREREEDELFLLRHLTYVVHNALSKKGNQLDLPSELVPLTIDKYINQHRSQRNEERKQKSDELFARARERGELNENNEVIEDQ